MSQHPISRRHFFYGSLLAGAVPAAGFGSVASLEASRLQIPEREAEYRGHRRGRQGLQRHHRMPDGEHRRHGRSRRQARRARPSRQFPNVPKYKDFRQNVRQGGQATSTPSSSPRPDHMHGTAAMWAMERGKHVYCQKPLTRTVWEAQQLTQAAAEYGVATQMGNQGYSQRGARECCEIIWNGDIGNVTEVHAWTNRPAHVLAAGSRRRAERSARPADARLGSVAGRLRDRALQPRVCAAQLARVPRFRLRRDRRHGLPHPGHAEHGAAARTSPTSVECIKQEGKSQVHVPAPDRHPLRLPCPRRDAARQGVLARRHGQAAGDSRASRRRTARRQRHQRQPVHRRQRDGDHGLLRRAHASVPASKDEGLQVCPRRCSTRSPGHYRDWIRACKGGEPACSNFNVAAPFVQWMLLGVIAMRYDGQAGVGRAEAASSPTTMRRTSI